MDGGYRVKLWGESEGLVICCLLTLAHPTGGTFRFSTDMTQKLTSDPITFGTTSRGQAYTFVPVSVILPLDEPDSEPTARFSIANIDRRLVPLIRSVPDDVTATIEIIDPADPDNVQRQFNNLQVRTSSYDAMEIVLGMRVDVLQSEPFPSARFWPSSFPRLY